MSDNLYLNDRVAPHSIRYSQMTPLAFAAHSQKKIFFTSNQSTYSNTQTVIRIPISSATDMLDGPNSYLKFDYVNNDAAGGGSIHTCANSINSLFYRVRVISDKGGDMENILYYGVNHAAMADCLLDVNKRLTRAEQGFGAWGTSFQAAPVVPIYTVATTAIAANTVVAIQAAVTELETAINASCAARTNTTPLASSSLGCDEVSIAAGNTQTFCVPLDLSCLLGGGQRKMLPLFLTGGFTLEITLDPLGIMTNKDTQPLFTVQNVQYMAQCVTFDASVNQALTAMTLQSGLMLAGQSWTNVLSTVAPGTGFNWIISERLRSLKSIFFLFQDPAKLGVKNVRSSARYSNAVSQYQMKAGSMYLPAQQIKASNGVTSVGNAEFLVETFKAVGEYGNSTHSSLLNIYNFGADVNTAGTVGRALYGLDVDCFGRSDCESGISTIMNNPITISGNSTTAYANALNAYTLLYHDVVFAVTPTGELNLIK